MGGKGSGRPAKPENIQKRTDAKYSKIAAAQGGENIILPNLSGTKNEIKSGTHNISTDDLSEGSTNKYFSSSNFNTEFATKDTDDLTEGSTNLYDKTVTLSASGSATIYGSYPDFTVESTDTDTTYTAGTNLTLSGSTFSVDDAFLKNDGDTATGDYTFDADTLHIDSTNDRVGIGTTSPGYLLDVNGKGRFVSTTYFDDDLRFSNTNKGIEWQGTNNRIIASAPSNTINIYTAGSETMTLKNGDVGIGTTSPGNTLDVSGSVGYKIKTITSSSYTTLNDDNILLLDASSNPVTVTIQASSEAENRVLKIKRIDSSVNTVELQRSGSDTIDGATTISLSNQYDCRVITADGGSDWYILSSI